jgi:hypothetical protein
MNMRRATLAIVVLAFATVAAARTPAPSLASSLTIGQRVRVHSNAEPRFIIGGVSAVDDEFLTVVPDALSPDHEHVTWQTGLCREIAADSCDARQQTRSLQRHRNVMASSFTRLRSLPYR